MCRLLASLENRLHGRFDDYVSMMLNYAARGVASAHKRYNAVVLAELGFDALYLPVVTLLEA